MWMVGLRSLGMVCGGKMNNEQCRLGTRMCVVTNIDDVIEVNIWKKQSDATFDHKTL